MNEIGQMFIEYHKNKILNHSLAGALNTLSQSKIPSKTDVVDKIDQHTSGDTNNTQENTSLSLPTTPVMADYDNDFKDDQKSDQSLLSQFNALLIPYLEYLFPHSELKKSRFLVESNILNSYKFYLKILNPQEKKLKCKNIPSFPEDLKVTIVNKIKNQLARRASNENLPNSKKSKTGSMIGLDYLRGSKSSIQNSNNIISRINLLEESQNSIIKMFSIIRAELEDLKKKIPN